MAMAVTAAEAANVAAKVVANAVAETKDVGRARQATAAAGLVATVGRAAPADQVVHPVAVAVHAVRRLDRAPGVGPAVQAHRAAADQAVVPAVVAQPGAAAVHLAVQAARAVRATAQVAVHAQPVVPAATGVVHLAAGEAQVQADPAVRQAAPRRRGPR